jgi:hypothetical protein
MERVNACSLALTIPPSRLRRADRVVESQRFTRLKSSTLDSVRPARRPSAPSSRQNRSSGPHALTIARCDVQGPEIIPRTTIARLAPLGGGPEPRV